MTSFKENEVYKNFTLKKVEYIKEIDSTVHLFEHNITKTEVVAVKNDDTNKNFCITFKTTPDNSKGTPHIIEHCVLSGSEKFPLRDVFQELSKGGLTTFLNAMTSSDKTYYPFATRNNIEYFNLMEIYLDTTLKPLLTEEVFHQEGWHYELLDINEPITIKGIVYNEMKGAMSDPMDILYGKMMKTLMPNSTYSVNSGGDPQNIPDLSYEQFKDFHKKFYHPTNSKLFLYGDADLEKELEFIDKEYLSRFEFQQDSKDLEINIGDTIKEDVYEKYTYPIGANESEEGKTYIALASQVTVPSDSELNFCFFILNNLLFTSEASPIKNAIIDSGLSQDLFGMYNEKMIKTNLTVLFSGTDESKKDALLNLYYEELDKIVKNGIDKDLLLSEINSVEFKLNEGSINVRRGFNYMMTAVNSLVYETSPFESLKVRSTFGKIRENFETNETYFEDMVKKYLIKDRVSENKTAVIALVPDKEYSNRLKLKEEKKLEDYKKSLTEVQIEELIKSSKKLIESQNQKETKENLDKIKKLAIKDLGDRIVLPETTVDEIILKGNEQPITLLKSELNTNDIIYLSIGIDIDKMKIEFLPYLDLFFDLFAEIGTSTTDFITLSKEISTYIGGFSHNFRNYTKKGETNKDNFRSIMWLELKFLKRNFDKVSEIVSDLFKNTGFTNNPKIQLRIKDIIKREFIYKERQIMSEGMSVPVARMRANIHKQGQYQEEIKGLTAFNIHKELATDYEKNEDKFLSILTQIKEVLFNKENLILNITSDSEGIDLFKEKSEMFLSGLSDKHFSSLEESNYNFKKLSKNQAFVTTSEIVFAAYGGNLTETGMKYSGKFEVLKNYLANDYLFGKIRAIGGAYGVRVLFNENEGDFIAVSYRDPNVADTYTAYKEISEAIKNIDISEEELTNFKIGAYADFNPLMGINGKGLFARNCYLTDEKPQDFYKITNEILETTLDDLKSFAPYFEKLDKNSIKNIIGNETKIMKDKELFSEIIKL